MKAQELTMYCRAKDKEFPQYPRSNNTGRGWGKGFLARDLFKLDSYDPFHDPMDDKTAQLRADYCGSIHSGASLADSYRHSVVRSVDVGCP